MDIEKIFALIDKAQASLFDRIEIETQDIKISLERRLNAPADQRPACVTAQETTPEEETPPYAAEDIVFTPIAGVFYAQSSPGGCQLLGCDAFYHSQLSQRDSRGSTGGFGGG